jgi:hypothetical protein
MWYRRLNALWDGSSYLALMFAGGTSSRDSLASDLYVWSATDPNGMPALVAVIQRRSPESDHVVRLPDGHRFVRMSVDAPSAASLEISLEDSIGSSSTEWRLVLLQVSADGQPRFDLGGRSTRVPLRRFLRSRLRSTRDGTVVWGAVCRERRVLPRREDGGTAKLAISAIETVFPEGAHIAPIEIEAMPASAAAVAQGSGPIGANDPRKPLLVALVEAESARHPRYGLRLRTSREDPTVQWVQERSAIVHVRRQALLSEHGGLDQSPAIGPVSRPFDQADVNKIGALAPEPENMIYEMLFDEPAIRACSLSEALAGKAPMNGVEIEPDEPSDRGKHGPADQARVWFDSAALGDDVGLVSTQGGALKRLAANGAEIEGTDVALYRVTSSGLVTAEISDTERELLISEAAAVQPHDADAEDALAEDQQRQAIEAARRQMNEWYSRTVNTTVSLSFDKLAPVITAAAVRQVQDVPIDEQETAGRLFELCRSDPALCSLLDAASLTRAAWRPPAVNQSLLRRFANANNVSGAVAVEGVRPEAQVDALSILKDIGLRRRLSEARIALDSSTSNLRDSIEEALSALEDRASLAKLAGDLKTIRSRADDANQLGRFLDGGEWTELHKAVELARAVTGWRAARTRIDNRIRSIRPAEEPAPSPSGGPQQRPDEVRDEIRKIYAEHGTISAIATILNEFDLDELDQEHLLQLRGTLLTMVYGPEREQLVNELLEKLEAWAGLQNGFFIQLAQSERAGSQRNVPSGRRDGAAVFIKRIEEMRPWQPPPASSANTSSANPFLLQRIAVQRRLVERWQPDIPLAGGSSDDFQRLVAPVGDHLLHHLAFRALRGVSAAARSRALDDPARLFERKLARGLVAWPQGAAVTWEAGWELAKVLGPSQSQRVLDALAPPSLN